MRRTRKEPTNMDGTRHRCVYTSYDEHKFFLRDCKTNESLIATGAMLIGVARWPTA